MKRITFWIVLLLLASLLHAQTDDFFNDNYKAQYHYSPAQNRMGAPISSFITDSIHHIFFQYNPHNLQDGFVNWGHISSSDFLTWKEHDLSFTQPETATDSMQNAPWSGTICKKNTTFFAWINRWDNGIYTTTGIDGKNWEQEKLTSGLDSLTQAEFSVFWHTPTQKWVMVAFDRKTTTMYLFNSTDGLAWTETSSFNYTFGFPQLFELPVDRKTDDTRWILLTESGTYMIGQFDGKTFKIETSIQKFNHSVKLGGTLALPSDNPNSKIVISNLKGEQQADLASYGQFTFPLELTLHKFEDGLALIQKPLNSWEKLKTKSYTWNDEKIYPGIKNTILKRVKGTEVHMHGIIDVLNCDQMILSLRTDRYGQGTEVIYNAKKSEINFLGTRIDYKPQNNIIEFEVFVDRSSIEVLIDGGRYVMSYPFSPSPESIRYAITPKGGEILIKNLEANLLNSGSY